MTQEKIENATLEAIYWWNRDEDYYHKHFSQLDNIFKDKSALDFFIKKIFDMFLREYSVRRNLSQGPKILNCFFEDIFKTSFFEDVKGGKVEVIDNVSELLKNYKNSTNRHTKSLLSKVAFLINPHKFYLYDSLAKKSIWFIFKDSNDLKQIDLENYEGFIKQTELLRKSFSEKGLFQYSIDLLNKFKDTESYKFFSQHNEAFEMRIVDKYLWLFAQELEDIKFDNSIYVDFKKYSTV